MFLYIYSKSTGSEDLCVTFYGVMRRIQVLLMGEGLACWWH